MPLLVTCLLRDAATTGIYTLSLHDALPIFLKSAVSERVHQLGSRAELRAYAGEDRELMRHVFLFEVYHEFFQQIGRAQSELQSRRDLVCRLLLEKKKKSDSSVTCPLADSSC